MIDATTIHFPDIAELDPVEFATARRMGAKWDFRAAVAAPMLREGGLLLGDNTLPDAVLTDEDSGTKRYNAAVAQQPELASIVIPVLRGRGIDGKVLA